MMNRTNEVSLFWFGLCPFLSRFCRQIDHNRPPKNTTLRRSLVLYTGHSVVLKQPRVLAANKELLSAAMAAIEQSDAQSVTVAPADDKGAGHQQQHGARFTAAHDACQSFMSRFQQQKKVDPFAGQASFSIGPLDVYSGSLIRQFRVRQKVELNDRLSASAGLFYDLSAGNLGPWGTLTYKLEPNNKQSKSRIELSTLDRRLLVRKGWEVNIKHATVGVSAEARLNLVEQQTGSKSSSSLGSLGGYSVRPDLHISLDHVKPLKYELIGIGLVLLLGLPLSLNNKEVEAGLPLGLGRLKGFGRASVKRTGYMSYKLGAGETSGVLDL